MKSSNTPRPVSNGRRSSAPTTKTISLVDQLRVAFQNQIPLKYEKGNDRYTVLITEDPVPAFEEGRSIDVSPVDNPPLMLFAVKPYDSLSGLPT